MLIIFTIIAVTMILSSIQVTGAGKRTIDIAKFDKQIRSTHLPLDAAHRDTFLNRIAARERLALVGGTIGLLAGVIVGLILKPIGPAAILLGTAFGVEGAGVIAIVTGRHQINPEGPRVARLTTPTVRDYVPTPLRIAELTTPILLAATLTPALVAQNAYGLSERADLRQIMTMVWIGSLVASVTWLGSLIAARVAVVRPQHATDELELAWDDVSRADAFTNLSTASVATTVFAMTMNAVGAMGIVMAPESRAQSMDGTERLAVTAFVVYLVTVWPVLIAMIIGTARRRRHAIGRLWANATWETEHAAH